MWTVLWKNTRISLSHTCIVTHIERPPVSRDQQVRRRFGKKPKMHMADPRYYRCACHIFLFSKVCEDFLFRSKILQWNSTMGQRGYINWLQWDSKLVQWMVTGLTFRQVSTFSNVVLCVFIWHTVCKIAANFATRRQSFNFCILLFETPDGGSVYSWSGVYQRAVWVTCK